MLDYRKIITNREFRLKLINLLRFIPDKPYLKMVYRIKSSKKLNLRHPKTFCDKLNYLKLYDRRPEYTTLVDKVACREYIKEVIGEAYCIPMLGAWDHYDDIDFDTLPDKFVLKCNHDSGSVKIISDKSAIDHNALRKFYEGRLKQNPYVLGREYPYRDVPPKIYAEEYMIPGGEKDISDYKFFCFDGKPEIMYVTTERSNVCKIDYFDMDFHHIDMGNKNHFQSGKEISKPQQFEEMKVLAAKLSKGMRFVRIDLYEIDNRIYFSEFTFFHAGGFWPMYPEEWEYKLGDLIHLD